MKRGVVYACSNEKWMRETVESAISFATLMPDLARELYGPRALLDNCRFPDGLFTKVVKLDKVQIEHRPRFESFLQTTLDEVLFLDGDTHLVEPIYDVFDLLRHFDAGLTIAPQLHSRLAFDKGVHKHMPSVSLALAEYNGGFIAAKNNARFKSFVMRWIDYFITCLAHDFSLDQASLRVAVATSDMRIATLPANYNFRAHVPQVIGGRVKLLHAHAELKEIAKTINQTENFRNYQPDPSLTYGFFPRELALEKARQAAQKERKAP
jgi:hypothetical protein